MKTLLDRLRKAASDTTREHEGLDPNQTLEWEAAEEIERLRSLVKEAADHINGTTGARSRPNSDSGDLVARLDAALLR